MMPAVVSQSVSVLLFVLLIVQLVSLEQTFLLPQQSYGVVKDVKTAAWESADTSMPTALFASNPLERDSLLFVGDVLLARNIESLMLRNGENYPFAGIDLASFSRSGYVIGNFESSVPEIHQPTATGELQFSVNEKILPSLRQAGFTHLSLANNHALDFGAKNFTYTTQALTKSDIITFGHPSKINNDSVVFLEAEEVIVALIGIHTLTHKPTAAALAEIFSYASARSDLQIAYVHWGTEYKKSNDQSQRNFAEALVAAGADLIIGHHPHVVQNVDLIGDVPVFYSLGNYIFDQYFSAETQEGLVLHLDLATEPMLYLLPVTSQASLSQPQLMNEQEHFSFLQKLATQSDPKLAEGIAQGILPLNSLVATSSKIAMMVR